jgi:hypothetical protein
MFHANARTDGHDEAFRNFVNAPENGFVSTHLIKDKIHSRHYKYRISSEIAGCNWGLSEPPGFIVITSVRQCNVFQFHTFVHCS